MSRDLNDLEPPTRELCLNHIAECRAIGVELLVYCTYRSPAEQDALYAQGRTTPGKIVTNARGGDSFHQYRVAYDCVPLVNGKPAWNDPKLYRQVGLLGEKAGLVWSGRWTGPLRETAHFQSWGGNDIAEFRRETGQ